MATSLVTEFQSVTGDAFDANMTAVDEPAIDHMFDQDHDFSGLGVDFDFCTELQLDGVDLPTDIWNTEMVPTDPALEASQKTCEKFSIDEDFNQMLDDWDNQLDSIHTSEIDDLLPKLIRTDNGTAGDETDAGLPVQQTVTLKKPSPVNSYRGQITSGQTRQVPASTPLRAPVVTRGVCYTRSGGIGVSRSVHTSGVVVNSSPRVSLANQFSVANRQNADEASFLFTPVSPIRSPVASSNAPDFFIASTRSTADVVKSSYSRLVNQCRNSIITTNPDSEQRNSQVKIIAAVSPKSDGTSTAKILSSHNSIRESLPKELIDKIRAASQGRKTIAIIEPINRKDSSSSVNLDQPYTYKSKTTSKYSSTAAAMGKWKNMAITPSYLNNVSDHDYCSPGRASRFTRKYLNAQSKVMKQIEESLNRSKMASRVTSPVEEGETKKDSGLESCEMSDASEDGSSVYDKLPRYLTNASVQTVETRSVQDDHGYNRLPAYLIKPQQSLLKNNLSKSVADKHNIVVSPVECIENSENKPDISLAEPANVCKVESTIDKMDSSSIDGMYNSRVVSTERMNSESVSKRRLDSLDSSSDETDSSFRKSYKRRRSIHPRPSSRDSKRRRYRGRSRSCSSSTERSSSRSGWRSRPSSREQERSRRHIDRRDRLRERKQQQLEHKVQVEERKIIYVGKIEEGILKSDLRSRFEAFGPIVDISVHFREHGDNYGFLTFKNQADAYRAIEHGNDDSTLPKYDLCFGGRRTFCREDYCDLDDVEIDGVGGGVPGFDELLRLARKEIRK